MASELIRACCWPYPGTACDSVLQTVMICSMLSMHLCMWSCITAFTQQNCRWKSPEEVQAVLHLQLPFSLCHHTRQQNISAVILYAACGARSTCIIYDAHRKTEAYMTTISCSTQVDVQLRCVKASVGQQKCSLK